MPREWACLMYRIDCRLQSIARAYQYVYREVYPLLGKACCKKIPALPGFGAQRNGHQHK
jgi:hypothetical protein